MLESINILLLYISLIPKTSYDFRVIAENAIGHSDASEVIIVETTDEIIIGPARPDIITTSKTVNSITIKILETTHNHEPTVHDKTQYAILSGIIIGVGLVVLFFVVSSYFLIGKKRMTCGLQRAHDSCHYSKMRDTCHIQFMQQQQNRNRSWRPQKEMVHWSHS